MSKNVSRTEHNRDPQPAGATVVGNVDDPVATVQSALIVRGYSCGRAGHDGIFGADTDAAVRRFQTRAGVAVDGIVGPQTWGKLKTSTYTPPARKRSGTAAKMVDYLERLYSTPPAVAYRFGVEVTNLATEHPAALDCSEAVQLGVYHAAGVIWVDGSWNQAAACELVSVRTALETPGALVFISSNGLPSGVHHVGVAVGDGHHTLEARSAHSDPNCGRFDAYNVSGSPRFNLAGYCPVLGY